jgi:luciferase family oxidoreductase group 1
LNITGSLKPIIWFNITKQAVTNLTNLNDRKSAQFASQTNNSIHFIAYHHPMSNTTSLKNVQYSVLDLAQLLQGDTVNITYKKLVQNAQHAETLGYTRFWISEHHNMPNVMSPATSVLIGLVGENTKTIRVGSGGIMLPNHSTLSVAENFGTLEALYPDRIDLGLGRAPGTDGATAQALRRGNYDFNYNFESNILDLQQYFSEDNRRAKVRALPGEGANVPLYILGSSTDSAYLAAKLGLPYAFAGHFAPTQFLDAIRIYRERFQPSDVAREPYVMVCVNAILAGSDEEAQHLSRSMYQGFYNILVGERRPVAPPDECELNITNEEVYNRLQQMTALSFIGSQASVKEQLEKFVDDTQVQEIIFASSIFDFDARLNSFKFLSEIFNN